MSIKCHLGSVNYTILILDFNPIVYLFPNKLVKLGMGVAGEGNNLYFNWPISLHICIGRIHPVNGKFHPQVLCHGLDPHLDVFHESI